MLGESPALSSPVSLRELEAQITALAGQLNAAQYRWLSLIAEFDRRRGWHDGKLPSCAHWLNFKVGLNLGSAREKVRVAHALEGLPKIAASMARGELSYSKVRAITRVACAATEGSLLMIGLHGTAHHVETLVRGYRRAQEAAELSREARQHKNRSVTYGYDPDGGWVLHARLPAVAGAMLAKALEAAMDTVPWKELRAGKVEEGTIPFHARRADALAAVAEGYLARSATKATPASPNLTVSPDQPASPGQVPRPSSTADRFQVIVHVDAETLVHHTAGRCEIEQGPSIPAETVRRLTCDASLLTVLENADGEPLDVGRKTRTIPPAIRRALNTRDAGCRFPGCTHQRYLDAHHIEHWADGGDTKLSNLVTLCRLHHRLVHEGEIRVETLANGGWRFLHPDGRPFDIVRPTREIQYDGHELESTHAALGIHIDKHTAATRWRGERMDYGQGVMVLFERVRHFRDDGAGIVARAAPSQPPAAGQCDVPAGTRSNSDLQPEEHPNWVPWWRRAH